MAILKWLGKMPEFATYPKIVDKRMRNGKRLAELSAMPRVFNLLIEERVGVNVESNYIC